MPTESPSALTAVLAARYAVLLARLAAAADAADRDPASIRVVAVTKGIDLETVRAAVAAGIQRFGENRIQEALPKVEAVPSVDWHLVGRLQANKARRALGAFPTIHSVDTLALLERLDRLAEELGNAPAAYLQVNVTGEASKAGLDADRLETPAGRREVADAISSVRQVSVVGLMTIGPLVARADEARPFFRRLRELREALQEATGHPLPELSMGMSADAEAAVAEGATVVRIGTAIFGLHRH